ncbi:DUF4870 domain-containing protein [Archangium sp.]|jgi:hypothetical protein|uniref:DUF4870 domain-containing protein n=1 Tax=Archangium sp. TaxID=1872627 RepID=UPI002ED81A9B
MEQQGQQVGSFITGSSMPTQDEKTWGMLSHLSGLLLAFIGPLIIWQTKGKESAWVERQAIEALNFQITVGIAFVASFILTFVLIGACLMPLVGLAALVLSIIGGIKANNGEAYRYPATIRLIK